MRFREQQYSKFESMDCVTQAMKESVGYQGRTRIIPAPKTWNFVKKRLAKALCLKAKINGEPNILVPELTCTLNLLDFEIWV